MDQYFDIFKGFVVLPFTDKIKLKDDAKPVVYAPRWVPAPLQDKLKQELDCMTSLGVIKKVEEPTELVSYTLFVNKENRKICMHGSERLEC